MANEILGSAPCDSCGGWRDVMQAKRKGAHLYSRCKECGLDQRTGKGPQEKLWHETDWKPGARPTMPENVTEKRSEPVTEKTTEKASAGAALADFDPGEIETEKQPTRKPKKRPKGALARAAGVTLIIAAIGGLAWKA